MKSYYLLFAIAMLALSISNAHGQIEITRPIEQYGFNQKTVVTNAKGEKYTYVKWRELMATGNYMLKPVQHDSDSSAFILTKRDAVADGILSANANKPPETRFFKTGNAFSFFNMRDVNGNVITAADLKGKIVVLNFWFIACPPCRYEMPELNRLVDAYQNSKDVVFIAISLDKAEQVEQFLKVSPFKYHVISDSMPLFSYYGVDECPVSLVVDREGVIQFNSQGYGDGMVPNWIRKTISDIK
ncbi:TlpA disulfide reductase family protein [Mucilaginibacter sp. cycad4]|uniref:peroxiredoxin family protein n=1 Tax=Mucilaginibacter sp. cycad4 TaxID=3342096 RepID=UPI002AAB4326|nr:TlpA disulfide reductase family protein [Mucilaginibacter gossypii]WPV00144.1 TlpA disulfide reductase family protein [Mucilaginibacter gossypii]